MQTVAPIGLGGLRGAVAPGCKALAEEAGGARRLPRNPPRRPSRAGRAPIATPGVPSLALRGHSDDWRWGSEIGGAAPWPLGVPGDKGWGQALKPLALAPPPQGLPGGGTSPSPRPALPRPGKCISYSVCNVGPSPGRRAGLGCQLHRLLLRAGRAGREDPVPRERASEQERVSGGAGATVPVRRPPSPAHPLCPTPALHQGLGCPRLGSLPCPAPSARLPSRGGHPRGDGVWVGAADVPMAQERRRRWVSRWMAPFSGAGRCSPGPGQPGPGEGRARVLPSGPVGAAGAEMRRAPAPAGQRCSPAPRLGGVGGWGSSWPLPHACLGSVFLFRLRGLCFIFSAGLGLLGGGRLCCPLGFLG